MRDVEALLERLAELVELVDGLEEPLRSSVIELLDGIDTLHRASIGRLADAIGPEAVEGLSREEPAIAWLMDAYGVDRRDEAEAALDSVRPYVDSHGGRLEVLDARGGVVRVRMSGSCAGCTASAITLERGVEQALRDHFPGFVALEVEQDEAPSHPPPGPTLLQIERLA